MCSMGQSVHGLTNKAAAFVCGCNFERDVWLWASYRGHTAFSVPSSQTGQRKLPTSSTACSLTGEGKRSADGVCVPQSVHVVVSTMQ